MTTGDQAERDDGGGEPRPAVAATRCSPDRTVFAEQGNTDAWIATDLTVDLDR